ncbi:MAG: putative hydrolase [Ilumatobacteraceae bacterium]|nr:putative hydrolase [Ilumatobacteraceae bacterium]
MAAMERIAYDEFGLFHENAAEYGLPFSSPPVVRRTSVGLPDGREVSALVWGHVAPEVVLIHGGAQNAHTWDTVLMAVGRPAIAIDLPGHGHSGWRDDGAYTPRNLADDVAVVIEALAPDARLVVGMSLGGMTSIELAAHHPTLVRSLLLVDITPGVNAAKAKAVIDFVDGPQSFPDFQSLLDRTMQHNPTRAESSLRRGILHNAHQLDDGSWKWNYDRRNHARSTDADAPPVQGLSPLWDDFGTITCPMVVVRGSLSPVVDDDDIAECRRRQPDVRVEVVDGAGHSIQGDRPLELAALIDDVLGD